MISSKTCRLGVCARRAFAMPIVVLLTLVIGLAVGVFLARQGVQNRTVARQVRAYQEYHAGRGMQEAIGAWLRRLNSREIPDAIGDDGHAMDILLPGGDVASVYVQDGQGQVLASLGALDGEALEACARVLDALLRDTSVDTYRRSIRRVGSWQISPNAADETVLRAVIASRVEDEGTVASAVSRILGDRAGGRMTRSQVQHALEEAGVSEGAETSLARIFTYQPELWFIRVELRPRGTRRVVARYGGLAYIGASSTQNTSAESGKFLTWEALEDPPPGSAGPGG